jgi:DNA-binding NtrC family response regulator
MLARRPAILIVDDHPELSRITAAFFRRKGYRVEEASSAEEAIEKIRSSTFDVVIADLRLPRITGLDVLTYHHQVQPKAIRILFTAVLSDTLRFLCEKISARYLAKPVPLPELLLEIESMLAAEKTSPDQ